MKAAVIRAYGAPEVLKYEEVPDPTIGPGEVLVKVVATSVNPFDVKLRSGQMKEYMPLTFPAILGWDVSGVVQEIGPEVRTFSVGDRVFSHAPQTYATLCAVKAVDLAKIPDGMEFFEVAALPTVTTTGAQLADLALGDKSSGTVLVTGAVGNVGRSAVCQAKQRGARVIAGVLKRQVEEARSINADGVLALDDAKAVDSLEPLDAVADTINGPVADKLITKIKKGGVFATVLGPPSTASAYPDVRVEAMEVTPAAATMLRMAEAVRNGKLTIPLGQQFPLKDADKAHAAAENHAVGKIILMA